MCAEPPDIIRPAPLQQQQQQRSRGKSKPSQHKLHAHILQIELHHAHCVAATSIPTAPA
jgi:hypothetical protein